MRERALAIEGLDITIFLSERTIQLVRSVTLDVAKGEVLGLVGESGCGKSVTALACLGLLPSRARIAGRITAAGIDVTKATQPELRRVRGGRCAMIFQDPGKALNPFLTIGRQMTDVIVLHRALRASRGRAVAVDNLSAVGVPDPEAVLSKYPHQVSGGQLQRVMIAMALSCNPDVLIADEPTTALDVTIQAQIIALLRSLARDQGLAVLFITHDLGVIASLCDRVAVMYAGTIVEEAPCHTLFADPLHPYTERLLQTVPQLGGGRSRLVHIPGQVPDFENPPSGCRFHPRCDRSTQVCREIDPELRPHGTDHTAACHHAGEPARQPAEKKKAAS